MFAILEFYLDDSGTHGSSTAVVWGGVVGHQAFLDELSAQWTEQLKCPCEGRPPIKKFHSYLLARGLGEFDGYNQGERDLTRRNFRQIIVECGVTVLAYGVSVIDWDQIVRGVAKRGLNTAEHAAFGQAVLAGMKAAKAEGEPISFQFDQGRDTPELRAVIKPALEAADLEGHHVSYGFSPVEGLPALQAADLVAHEAYQFFKQVQTDPKAQPGPHTARLFADAHDSRAAWLGRREIKAMVQRVEKSLRRKYGKAAVKRRFRT